MIVDGREIARDLEAKLKTAFANQGKRLRIEFLSFGDDPATRSFLSIKKRAAERVGVDLSIHELPENTLEGVAQNVLAALVNSESAGVVVQLPLPEGWSREDFLQQIPAKKDVDCISPVTLECYGRGENVHTPPVAAAVEEILQRNNVDLTQKKVAVVGFGNLVGKPVSLLLRRGGVEHEVFDIGSNLMELKGFDVVISGVGKPGLITKEMVKEGSILIDAGTSELGGELVGDIDSAAYEQAALVTPVPGGVGPITVAKLFENLL